MSDFESDGEDFNPQPEVDEDDVISRRNVRPVADDDDDEDDAPAPASRHHEQSEDEDEDGGEDNEDNEDDEDEEDEDDDEDDVVVSRAVATLRNALT